MPLHDELNGFLKPLRFFFGIGGPESGNPDVGILGIPYDLTSSYISGSRLAPDAIRHATDRERSHSFPLVLGDRPLITNLPLSKMLSIEDLGDLEVTTRPPESAYYDIADACTRLLPHARFLLFLGGDHFVTYPIMRGLTRAIKKKWGLLYLDAHADMYQSYDAQSYSHATTLNRILESNMVSVENVIAYDLRAALPEHRKPLVGDQSLELHEALTRIEQVASNVDHIHISIDLDVVSPCIAPAVGHPESGGLSVEQLIEILRAAFRTRLVRTVDLVEFNPMLEGARLTSITVRDIVKEVLTGFAYQKY